VTPIRDRTKGGHSPPGHKREAAGAICPTDFPRGAVNLFSRGSRSRRRSRTVENLILSERASPATRSRAHQSQTSDHKKNQTGQSLAAMACQPTRRASSIRTMAKSRQSDLSTPSRQKRNDVASVPTGSEGRRRQGHAWKNKTKEFPRTVRIPSSRLCSTSATDARRSEPYVRQREARPATVGPAEPITITGRFQNVLLSQPSGRRATAAGSRTGNESFWLTTWTVGDSGRRGSPKDLASLTL